MKKILPVMLLVCSFTQSLAQDGLLVRAQAGAGASRVEAIDNHFGNAHMACDCGYDIGHQSYTTSVSANAEVGYQYKRVRLITGLQLITTGNLQGASTVAFPSGKTYYYPITDAYSSYNHFLVPISLSVRISLHGRSSLYPEIGTRIMFIADNDKTYGHPDIKGHFFTAKLNYEYALNQKLSLAVTPAYYSVATPVFYTPNADYNKLISFNHVFMLQAGVVWHLRNPKTTNAPTGIEADKKSLR